MDDVGGERQSRKAPYRYKIRNKARNARDNAGGGLCASSKVRAKHLAGGVLRYGVALWSCIDHFFSMEGWLNPAWSESHHFFSDNNYIYRLPGMWYGKVLRGVRSSFINFRVWLGMGPYKTGGSDALRATPIVYCNYRW